MLKNTPNLLKCHHGVEAMGSKRALTEGQILFEENQKNQLYLIKYQAADVSSEPFLYEFTYGN